MDRKWIAIAFVALSLIFLAIRQDVHSEDSAVELSMRMRGHDLTGKGPKASSSGHKSTEVRSTASPHASSPVHQPSAVNAAPHKGGGDQLWRTEQAMKKQLDADTTEKSGSLWKQTVDIVHKSDPNAKFIQESFGGQHVSTAHGPHHAKAGASARLRQKSMSMKARLKQELNAKVWSCLCSSQCSVVQA